MNDLIVETASPTAMDCAEGLRILGPGLVAKSGIENGSALTPTLAGASVVTDTAEFFVDPIASMASSAASFLMEYVEPLREALDSLAGSPAAVSAQTQTWSAIANRVQQTSDEYMIRTTRALDGWDGPAAAAYEAFVGTYTQVLEGVGTLCSGVSGAMAGASGVVGFVRTIVRESIADLVGKLASWALKVSSSAGLGAAWVIPEATGAISLYVNKVRMWISDLVRTVKNISDEIVEMNESLAEVVPVIGRIRAAVDVPIVPRYLSPAETPNLNDLVPHTFTMVTNAANSGLGTASKASEEPS